MSDLHAKLWSEGLDHWHLGHLKEAEAAIRAAIAAAGDADLFEYHASLGSVLAQQGKGSQAEGEFEAAVTIARQTGTDESSAVVTARYFLGEHLLAVGRPMDAIAVTEPSVGVGARAEGILRLVRALAMHAAGQSERAVQEAHAAIEGALSSEQRDRFTQRLRDVVSPAV